MGLPFYRVLSISHNGHFVRMECYCILYSIAQKSFINTFIIKIFFRTQKDFEMMTKMKMKLNPQNSVSYIFMCGFLFCFFFKNIV